MIIDIKPKVKTKVFIMNVPIDLHNEIKKQSIKYNTTMTIYVTSVIKEQINKESRRNILKLNYKDQEDGNAQSK